MILFILGCSITLNIVLILFIVFLFKFKNDDIFTKKFEGEFKDDNNTDEYDKLLKEKQEDKIMRNYFFGNSR